MSMHKSKKSKKIGDAIFKVLIILVAVATILSIGFSF